MTIATFDVTAWAVCFVTGLFAGALYFLCVRWNANLIARGQRTALVIATTLLRFAALAALLFAAARLGALPLLLMALGVTLARFVIVRLPRDATP